MRGRKDVRGSGQLGLERQAEALALVRAGRTMREVASRFGVTKNTIAGLWHRHGEPVPNPAREPTTVWARCEALEKKLDAVLAETVGVGRLSESEVEERKAAWLARQ